MCMVLEHCICGYWNDNERDIRLSLWCQISRGPQHTRGNLTVDLVGTHLGQSEIRHFGSEILIQENIGALEVAVDNGWNAVLMEGLQGPGTIEGYPQPGPPIQWLVSVVKVVLESAIGHELKDKEPVMLVSTIAKQPHQVRRVQSAKQVHLSHDAHFLKSSFFRHKS